MNEASKSKKQQLYTQRINVVDIEAIEPHHRMTFSLLYYVHEIESSSLGGLFGAKKSKPK
jgi:hypothetical protein